MDLATWWVNQGDTFEQEVRGGYLWSPKKEKGGHKSSAYDNMTYMEVGDRVFSYLEKQLRAVGQVVKTAVSSPQPASYGDRWEDEGWLVEVDFTVSETPYSPKADWEEIKDLFPQSIKPLTREGYGNQKVYLSKISDQLGSLLFQKLKPGFIEIPKEINDDAEGQYFEESEIWHDVLLEETQREAIVLARSGQGKFRKRVASFEKSCRVTDVSNPKLLIASHIKPWRVSSPAERLDGNNGLMLSPHVDRLFDSGWISFDSSGAILASSAIPDDLFDKWGIDKHKNVGSFTAFQNRYLEFHNNFIFKS